MDFSLEVMCFFTFGTGDFRTESSPLLGGHQLTQLTPTICNDDWTRLEFLSAFHP